MIYALRSTFPTPAISLHVARDQGGYKPWLLSIPSVPLSLGWNNSSLASLKELGMRGIASSSFLPSGNLCSSLFLLCGEELGFSSSVYNWVGKSTGFCGMVLGDPSKENTFSIPGIRRYGALLSWPLFQFLSLFTDSKHFVGENGCNFQLPLKPVPPNTKAGGSKTKPNETKQKHYSL